MKKLISFLLVFVMLLSMVPTNLISASAATSGTTGDCTWSLDGTVLTISGNGNMGNYSYNSSLPWGKSITNVIIEDGVTGIGEYAFYWCDTLTGITLGNDVTSIGSSAFDGCQNLTNVYISNLAAWCNFDCEDGTSNPLCHGANLYINNVLATNITIPDSVTRIGNYTFFGCTSLTEATIGNNVTSIGECAFSNCFNLTSISIPNSVTTIDGYAFSSCPKLTSITLGSGVTTISEFAFSNCPSLVSITIPDSITSINSYVFSRCTSLVNITIPESVTTIGFYAFSGCTKLTNITVLGSVNTIDMGAFSFCTSLANITIPDSVTSIGRHAFYSCSSLTDITVDSNNDYYASVDGVLFNKSKTELIQYPIGNGRSSYVIPNSITSIGKDAFTKCVNLISVAIPRGVTSIGEFAFSECDNLKSIAIPSSVVTIEGSVFARCNALRSITIPSSVIFIGEFAFENCTVLNDISVNPNNTYYSSADGVLFNKDKTKLIQYPIGNTRSSYAIPNNVAIINSYAFYNCTSLESITISDGVRSIGYCAFYGCISLAGVIIPDSVTDIDFLAFANCTSLSDVWYGGTQKQRSRISIGNAGNQGLLLATWHYSTGSIGKNPFKDIKKSDFYYEPVLWAVNNGITAGATKTTFEPNSACTRGQIATFLWRAAGQPTPSTSKNPFTDVKKSDYYYKAVLWAVGAGITSGTSKTTFSPNDPCTRGQIATFLWRANGGKKVNASNPFTDVKKSDYYYNAVLWAVKNNITAGTSKTTFEPNAPCTRGQIATFLYRAYN